MAAALMPQLAATFVEQRAGAFDLAQFGGVTSHSPRGGRGGTAAYYSSPRRQQLTPQKNAADSKFSPSPKRRTPRRAEQHGVDDVHSWTDQTLAANFTFVEEVGYGNWGSVWKVQPKQEGVGAPVRSVKLVHRSKNPTSSARVRALWQEFKAVRSLRSSPHPNIIDMSSFVITPSYAIITMSYHPRLMPVALPESRAKPYFHQLLSAVQHLHSHGITHQDLKPSNILLSADDRPILIDFGFATMHSLHSPDRFLSSLSWGTPEYLSPERAKGTLHDERLSDIWALGVTMYEIVVGRTPFEQSEDENFLNREQLEVYYARTLTGQFFGEFKISTDLENLIHLMVEPAVHLRLQSCSKALRHGFFESSVSPFSARSATRPSAADTPTRPDSSASYTHTPSTKEQAPSPRKTPKSAERKKGIIFYHDSSSDSPSSQPRKPSFPSARKALRDSTNRGSKKTPSTPKPFTLKKTPPPSRIPIRKGDIGTPVPLVKTPRTGAILGHRRLVSAPALVTPTQTDVPPVPPLPSLSGAVAARSSSLKSVKRKPVPALEESVMEQVLSSQIAVTTDGEDDAEVLTSSPSSPVVTGEASPGGSSNAPSPSHGTPTFVYRSYTIKVGSKASGGVASQFGKLSAKSLRRAPSAMSFAGLKSSMSSVVPTRRRRASLADSVYSLLEAEKVENEGSHTMPIKLAAPDSQPEIQRARLESFSRHIAHVMETKKDSPSSFRHVAAPSPAQSTSVFSSNSTVPVSPSPSSALSIASPPPRKSSLRYAKDVASSSPNDAYSPPSSEFKPGHRRIPTAIRSVPSILLFESGDDGDLSDSQCSRAETPLERMASPPPPPRMMGSSKVLPTWVPEEDSDEEDDADVDEPTVTLSSPCRFKGKASRTSSMGRNATPHTSPRKYAPSSPPTLRIKRQQRQPVRPSLDRGNTSTTTASNYSSTTRPLPFQNFDTVDDPRPSTSTCSTSSRPSSPSGRSHPLEKLRHKRSRSIMSFFLRSSTDLESRSASRASNTTSLGWGTSTEALGRELPPKMPKREKVKKGGRLRAAFGKVFR